MADDSNEPVETADGITIYGSADEILADNPLVQLLKSEMRIKLLTSLLVLEGDADSVSSITDRAGTGRRTWYNHVDALLTDEQADDDSDGPHFGVVERVESDGHGNVAYYRVKMDDPLVQALTDVLNLATARSRNDEDHVEAYKKFLK